MSREAPEPAALCWKMRGALTIRFNELLYKALCSVGRLLPVPMTTPCASGDFTEKMMKCSPH